MAGNATDWLKLTGTMLLECNAKFKSSAYKKVYMQNLKKK